MAASEKSNQATVGMLIRELMKEHGICESELARRVNLPQTTINRLLLGGTLDPRAHTLKPIADMFGVTIGQLCGFEPLTIPSFPLSEQGNQKIAWRFIPIIHWDQVNSWVFTKKNTNPMLHKKWIGTERSLSEDAFALPSLTFMQPRFRKNSVLIIDPKAPFKDGHFIIVALDGINPTVRKIVMDGADTFLKPFDQTQALIKLTKKHIVYGTIVESRLDTYHHE